ncbi:DNA-binding transcriptional regulator, LysR family [Megasphaera cerevisiae DSM 20462]|jgi:DNA-binding transcriptional LysR family regulator|nr:DNA-binding transcriptional regulator, LysR family [Megasphaera cerevisiae DSM 20462]
MITGWVVSERIMDELPSIQQLENFILYGKYRNFTAAAKAANITQSAFSFQMKKMEELVGVQLITRSNRGSDLTEAGEQFLQQVTAVMQELEQSLYDLRSRHSETVTVTVGTMLSLGDVLMNRHLAYFQKYHREIVLSVYNLEARQLLEELSQDRVDIISTFYLPQMDITGYEKVLVCKDELVYYAPRLDISGTRVTAKEAASQPLAQYSPQYLMNLYLEQYFAGQTSTALQVQAWFSTPYAIMQYCQQNRIGAVLPRRFLQAMGVVHGWYELDPQIQVPCYLLYKRQNPKYAQIQIFIEYIRTTYHLDPDSLT